ncbi:MAG: hypothetical protein H7Z42_22870 [Roseiflexaceae bacterium]|nr:hypothetical protein [Roseiflexaceae bacterium]
MLASNSGILAAIIGYGLFLWLGLYLLVRASLRVVLIRLAVAGLFGQAAFFLAAALTDSVADPARAALIERATWWTAVLPLAVWFHLSALIARAARQPIVGQAFVPGRALAGYAAALLLITLGTATNLFNDYAATPLRPGPAYLVYLLFQLVMTGGALGHFVLARSALLTQPRELAGLQLRQLTLLIGGSLPFALGGLWLGSRYLFNLALTPVPGYGLLFCGLALLGYGVAHYGMLLDGQNIRRDFLYTFTGIALLNVVYVLLLAAVADVSAIGLLALVSLVTLTHTAFDYGRSLLDRLFFSGAERTAREEAREFATALGTEPVALPFEAEIPAPTLDPAVLPAAEPIAQPDGAARMKSFKSEIRKALTSLKSPPRLVNSPLLALRVVEDRLAAQELDDNRLNRVAVLRELLIAQIDLLRPADGNGPRVGDAWRFYNVLHYPYVREFSRKGALAEARRLREQRLREGQRNPGDLEQVLSWLADVDEDTFYKWQRRASDAIAEALWET